MDIRVTRYDQTTKILSYLSELEVFIDKIEQMYERNVG